ASAFPAPTFTALGHGTLLATFRMFRSLEPVLPGAFCRMRPAHPLLHKAAWVLMLVLSACTTIPDRRYAIRSIDIDGNRTISDSDLEEQLASRESPRFLGLLTGIVYDYQIFNRYVLEADLQRIERYYRARGYYQARVRSGRVEFVGDRQVKVEVLVEEGPAVLVQRLDVHGLQPVA